MIDNITFVTTVKGRLEHLQRTLPLLSPASRVVVVDYDCPQSSGCWAGSIPNVKVVRVFDSGQFNNAKARNIGAKQVDTLWIGFIDCDIKVKMPLFEESVKALLMDDGRLILAHKDDWGLYGFMIMAKSDFDFIGGYDESMDGYAPEDEQVKRKLIGLGAKVFRVPECLKHMSHSNDLRTQFYNERDPFASWKKNADVMFPKADQFVREKKSLWRSSRS